MVYPEMPERLRKPRGRNLVSIGAVVLVMVLYIPTGLSGYARFGLATQADILKNFNIKDGMADVSRACVAITALCCFPMQHFPARAAMYGALMRRRASQLGASMTTPLTVTEGEMTEMHEDAANEMPFRFIAIEATAWTAASVMVVGLKRWEGQRGRFGRVAFAAFDLSDTS